MNNGILILVFLLGGAFLLWTGVRDESISQAFANLTGSTSATGKSVPTPKSTNPQPTKLHHNVASIFAPATGTGKAA